MNNNIVFDTLQFAKRAEKAGFTKQQAEFQAEEMANIISNEIATKRDLVDVKNEIISDLKEIRLEMEALSNRLVLKFGAMMVAAVGVLSVVIRLGH